MKFHIRGACSCVCLRTRQRCHWDRTLEMLGWWRPLGQMWRPSRVRGHSRKFHLFSVSFHIFRLFLDFVGCSYHSSISYPTWFQHVRSTSRRCHRDAPQVQQVVTWSVACGSSEVRHARLIQQLILASGNEASKAYEMLNEHGWTCRHKENLYTVYIIYIYIYISITYIYIYKYIYIIIIMIIIIIVKKNNNNNNNNNK